MVFVYTTISAGGVDGFAKSTFSPGPPGPPSRRTFDSGDLEKLAEILCGLPPKVGLPKSGTLQKLGPPKSVHTKLGPAESDLLGFANPT